MIVVVELVRLGVVGHEKIHPAIVVVVQHRNAERLAGGIVEAGAPGHILERSIALVVEKSRALAFVSLRRAVRLVLVVERAVLIGFNGPVDVVRDKEVQLAVVVVVEPDGAGGKSRISDSGLGQSHRQTCRCRGCEKDDSIQPW